ncbi:hypothetical protein [Antarcticimicrobium luteum]|uniref:Uncharacterized protein n=1 Tax=Antarcticimicrobium luteum TaxID=2547397 RepID=A0A4R5VGJ6_9RHOB|nr:hypothetical protein [Antarcticimicrobium luteum]TDK51784.1 hypothetical protein E1832_02505 [Antarcticimicrobium luteum]
MAHQDLDFGRRVDRLAKKHWALSHGAVTVMRPDGLLVTAPARRRRHLTLRILLLCAVGLFVFKALLLATVGSATYEDRVTRLSAGNAAEAAGAWVMQADPLSRGLAAQIRNILP